MLEFDGHFIFSGKVCLAMHNLGVMYANGLGVSRDYAKAAHWYRKAAEQGDGWAQTNLGLMYRHGQGVSKDEAKAAYWYRKAAERGNKKAQSNLGVLFAQGLGVLEDYVQAYAWWSIAATRGNTKAKENKSKLKRKMTPAQIAEAQKLSSELWEKYVVPFQKD